MVEITCEFCQPCNNSNQQIRIYKCVDISCGMMYRCCEDHCLSCPSCHAFLDLIEDDAEGTAFTKYERWFSRFDDDKTHDTIGIQTMKLSIACAEQAAHTALVGYIKKRDACEVIQECLDTVKPESLVDNDVSIDNRILSQLMTEQQKPLVIKLMRFCPTIKQDSTIEQVKNLQQELDVSLYAYDREKAKLAENYILETYLFWGEYVKGNALIDSVRENAKDRDGEVDYNALLVQCIAAADVLQQHRSQQLISQYRQQLVSIARAAYFPLSETLQESEEKEVSPPVAFEWSEDC